MTCEEKLLEALETLTATMNKGFSDMGARFEGIEARLGAQERKTKKAARRQALQESEIQDLKKMVYQLAQSQPCRKRGNAVAIRKEPVYSEFEERGISKVAAMRALRDAGAIKAYQDGKNTRTIYLDGHLERVIIVCMDPPDGRKEWTKS